MRAPRTHRPRHARRGSEAKRPAEEPRRARHRRHAGPGASGPAAKPRRARPDRRGGFTAGEPAAGFRVAGRVWLERDGETYLAWGRVVLLERIAAHGSISAAARSMGMGYRHAWELVDAMNRLAPAPLVAKAAGGRRGGGARLTPAGADAVAEFWRLVEEFREWLGDRRLVAAQRDG